MAAAPAPAAADPFSFNTASSIDDAFSFAKPAAPAPAAAPASNDPFGFSGVGDINSAFSGLTASQPAQPVQRPQPAPQPAQSSGFDFFGAPAQPAQPMQQPMQQLQPQRMRQRLEQRRPLRIVDLLFHECSRLSKHNAFVCPVFFLFISIS